MTPQEEKLLTNFKKIWPEMNWPETLDSFDKDEHNPSFIKELKSLVKDLKEKGNNLTFYESAVIILWRRLDAKFKPEIITKKTKLKTPRVGAFETVDCGCGNDTGVWEVVGQYPLTWHVKLKCTKCEEFLSEVVQIAPKAIKPPKPPKEKKEVVPKEIKPKKPTKKDIQLYDSLIKFLEVYKIPIEAADEESLTAYKKVLLWRETNEKNIDPV